MTIAIIVTIAIFILPKAIRAYKEMKAKANRCHLIRWQQSDRL